jgi:hypothetical protein
VEIDGAGARPVSRKRNHFKHLDTLAAELAKRLRVSDAILDGEIICADETGRPIFIEMLHGRGDCRGSAYRQVLDGGDIDGQRHDSGAKDEAPRCLDRDGRVADGPIDRRERSRRDGFGFDPAERRGIYRSA